MPYWIRRSTCLLLLVASLAHAQPLRIDLNADNDRQDQLTRGRENWRVSNRASAEKQFGDAQITLRAAGEATELTSIIWKAGYDTGATISSDGILAGGTTRNGQLQVILRGLKAGRHSLVSYHNWLNDKETPSKLRVLVNGEEQIKSLTPSYRAASDWDASTAYVEFTAREGEDITLTYIPDGSGSLDAAVLNGIELDVSDPARKARKPFPADLDEHSPEEPTLTWTAALTAQSHRVYLGTTPTDLKLIGETKSNTWPIKDLSVAVPMYFWRVDSVAADGTVTPGDVWSFRVRRVAFPGAEGYGRFAIGGRGGKVFNVTTLDDSGPGSLREAVEATGPRTVVFRVGGTIQLKSKLVVRNPYITIAGQTAPGDGICVRGFTFGNYGTHDSVIRYLRIRVGDESGQTMDGTGFASTDHSIMDHCSVSWSIDEAVSSRGAKNITFQRSIVSEALNIASHRKYEAGKGHSFAGSISGEIGSFHHNLIAHCAGRNWSLAGGLNNSGKIAGSLDLRNNVIYNWQHRTTDGGVKRMNFVNNLYLPGPATKVFHLVMPQEFRPDDPSLYFISGNTMEGHDYDRDNWTTGGVNLKQVPAGTESKLKSTEELFPSLVQTHSTKELLENVLRDAGANIPRSDAVDQRAMNDVRNRSFTFTGSRSEIKGIIDSQTDAGGWPDLKNGEAPADTDLDGMPDWFEHQRGLNPNDPSDQAKYRDDGYTNLERYLNWIVENGSIQPKSSPKSSPK